MSRNPSLEPNCPQQSVAIKKNPANGLLLMNNAFLKFFAIANEICPM